MYLPTGIGSTAADRFSHLNCHKLSKSYLSFGQRHWQSFYRTKTPCHNLIDISKLKCENHECQFECNTSAHTCVIALKFYPKKNCDSLIKVKVDPSFEAMKELIDVGP